MQGFNMGRYVPPDQEGVRSGNQLNGKHALGARAAKLSSHGILTVRFEMPFAVWCGTCPRPTLIGQGTRFNAEKKRVGSYYSSPVYSFRMKHAACGGWIEIRTDPKNTAYVVTDGGRKRDTGDDDGGGGAAPVPITTARERAEQRESAFAHLEKTIADRQVLEAQRRRLDALADASARQWDDPYTRNQELRRAFRAGRKARERDAARAEDLRARMGLGGLELLPESEEDARRARLVDFGSAPDGGAGGKGDDDRVLARPLFCGTENWRDVKKRQSPTGACKKTPRKPRSELAASKRRETLVSEILGNTRLATDPFLESKGRDLSVSKSSHILPGLKRKRSPDNEPDPPGHAPPPPDKLVAAPSHLVDYDSS